MDINIVLSFEIIQQITAEYIVSNRHTVVLSWVLSKALL